MDDIHTVQVQPGIARSTWRVRFAYRGDDIRPVSANRLFMVPPGSQKPNSGADPQSGAWVEVLGGRGPIWGRTIHQPNRADREVFLENGDMTRVQREAEGEFEVLIPDLDPNATFVLHASPSRAPEQAAEPRVKLRLSDLVRLERGDWPSDDPPKQQQ